MERIPSSTASPVLDTFELVRARRHLEGEVAIERLSRLAESLTSSGGALRYRIDGLLDDQGHPGAELHLAGRLQLACQRCNNALEFALDRTTRFRFVASEQELNALPIVDDEVEAMVGSHTLNFHDWLEEEAILSLPLVPRHEDCSPPLQPDVGAEPVARRNPFAVLAALKDGGSEPH